MCSRIPGFLLLLVTACAFGLAGCSVQKPRLATPQELAAFEQAGPIRYELDPRLLNESVRQIVDYHVISGDLLAVQLFIRPSSLQAQVGQNQDQVENRPFLTRVQPNGKATLPQIGDVDVGG